MALMYMNGCILVENNICSWKVHT